MMINLYNLKVKIFADGADMKGMIEMYQKPFIKGFTTNPTLMKKAGISDYEAFARNIVNAIPDRPISFEVFSDDFSEMERQAKKITKWGKNIYVKIPVMNTKEESSVELVRKLSKSGIKLNVTAMMTIKQVIEMSTALEGGPSSFLSIFAGRIANTGRDPLPYITAAVDICSAYSNIEIIWASPRELFNIFQANSVGCHIITVTNDILNQLVLVGKDLYTFSLETVKMFHDDAVNAGYIL